ncbi:MAG TPA: conjugal transfer protein TraN [Alphaproteobacteria bacterium]|nr:conjugal transfer protein TraN [Alphaproteobacteria bacterium]
MRKSLALMILFSSFIGLALNASFKDYARERQKQIKNTTKTTAPQTIPGFQTASPPETSLDNASHLKGATESVFTNNDNAKALKHMAENRPYFLIDLDKDPLVKNSTKSVQNPEKVLASPPSNRNQGTTYATKTCRESKPAIEFRCSKNLVTPTMHIEPPQYFPPVQLSTYWCGSGSHGPNDRKCDSRIYDYTPGRHVPENVQISPEVWTSDCGEMEEKTKKRACTLIQQICPKGRETRVVMAATGPNSTLTSRQITRSCWRYELIYACAYPSANTCEALRKSTCEQIQSTCLQMLGSECIEWQQTYRCSTRECPIHAVEEKGGASTGSFSLSPAETPPPPPSNNDMPEAIAKLSIFQEIQGEIRDSQGNINSLQIFKGESRKCTIAFGNFKNCCTNGKGWGVSVHLSHCEAEEKDLATRQKNRLCIKIGTYCAEKALGVCIRKKKSYCCFPTKLARILHEQGRPQVGIGWGKPKHPECRGFSIDELSRLDFDQLDLSELFSEILDKIMETTQRTTSVVSGNLSNRVSQMTHGFKMPGDKVSQANNKPTSGEF